MRLFLGLFVLSGAFLRAGGRLDVRLASVAIGAAEMNRPSGMHGGRIGLPMTSHAARRLLRHQKNRGQYTQSPISQPSAVA